MRRKLEVIEDHQERERTYAAMVHAAYERGGVINMAAYGEIRRDRLLGTHRWIAMLPDEHPCRWWLRPASCGPDVDLVGQPQSSQAPRSSTSWCSTRTPSRRETSSIARSSAGSSKATSRPHCSHTR